MIVINTLSDPSLQIIISFNVNQTLQDLYLSPVTFGGGIQPCDRGGNGNVSFGESVQAQAETVMSVDLKHDASRS